MNDQPPGSRESDSTRLARILLEFEDAWQRGQQPVIDDFLPTAPAERAAVLAELAAVDLERRLKAGEAIRAETYLSRYPELAADDDAVQRLRTTEEAQRQRQGRIRLEKSPDHCPRHEEAFLSTTQDGRYHPEPSSAPASNGNAGPATFPTIAGYEILGELGRGGMGIVYQARQVRLNRLVALKMLRAGRTAGPEELARFRNEAEAVARLHHPHIVQIYEVDGPDHQPYFAFEYIDGGNLAQKIQGTPQPPHQAAALLETLARAVHYAHQHGIIHRDLKPLNILLQKSETTKHTKHTKQEEFKQEGPLPGSFSCISCVSWFPKITDFGLAKSLDAKQGQTRTGDLMGTPAYMAPEQAAGKPKEIGPATDVYALGAILYELLTGRPPFRGETTLETLDQVRSQEPVRTRRLRPSLRRDLDTICLKCLAKEPHKRYATALALAEDLKRFLNGEPIRARPVSWWEKGIKWARRHPAVAALSAGVVAVILLAFSIVVWQWREARQAWEEAATHAAAEGEAKEKADAARQLAENQEREAIKARQIAERGQREALEQRENARDTLEFLAGLFHGSDPTGLEGLGFRSGQNANAKISVLELLNNGTRNVNAQRIKNPAVRATLLDQLGNLYRSLGFLDKAGPLLEEALDLRQTHCGPEHEDTATSLYHVAWLYHDRGQYADAQRVYRQAWAIRQKRFGNDSLPCAQVMFNLAWTLAHQFGEPSATRYEPSAPRYEEAEQLLRQVLKVREEQLGDNHREVGVTLAALATLRFPKNETEGALLALRAIGVLERAETKDALTSGLMKYYWARDARQKYRYAEAEALYRDCLTEAMAYLGDRHPAVGMLLGDFAGLQRNMGDLAGAEASIRQALDIGRRSMRNHPAMIQGLMELADHVRERGAIQEAESLHQEAIDIAQRLGRPDLGQAPLARLVDLLENRDPHDESGANPTAPP